MIHCPKHVVSWRKSCGLGDAFDGGGGGGGGGYGQICSFAWSGPTCFIYRRTEGHRITLLTTKETRVGSTQPGNIDEPCLALHRSQIRVGSNFVHPGVRVHHILFGHLPHVAFTEHAPFNFPVVDETFFASLPVFIIFIFTGKMLNVISFARVRHGAGSLDRSPAIGCCT